ALAGFRSRNGGRGRGRARRGCGVTTLGPMSRTYHLTTFGCQMNEHDSERMAGMLDQLGYQRVDARDDADVILFNTCSIRESADNRFIGHLGEAKRLAADGVKEVTLLGQNVNSYGRDLSPRVPFSELLAMVDAVDGIERIRYTSPHPKDMREDVIRAHAELPSLCEHIHLPLQS